MMMRYGFLVDFFSLLILHRLLKKVELGAALFWVEVKETGLS